MSRDRYRQLDGIYDEDEPVWRPRVSPGKITLSSRLPVQRKAVGRVAARDVEATAAQGVAGTPEPLPHLGAIQVAFGRHDLGGVQAFRDQSAVEATEALGADAFAIGSSVALGPNADLHTTAHEAAHVVQQRGGVQLAGGVGTAGDAYERHADAVADLVVQGRSAEPLLDEAAPAISRSSPAVQRQAIQFANYVGANNAESVSIIRALIDSGNVPSMTMLLRAMRQTAARRVASDGTDRVRCHGEGDDFDLHISAADADGLQPLLEQAIASRRSAALDSALAPAESSADDEPVSREASAFEQAFNTEFADILPSLIAGRHMDGGRETLTEEELQLMFTAGQRAKLMAFCHDHVVPDRLFDGDEVGGATTQQRLVISAHILANGSYRAGSFAQRLHARMCGHWARLTHHYAGVSEADGAGVEHQFDHDGNVVLGGSHADGVYSGSREGLDPSAEHGSARRYRQTALPLSQFDTIHPGDWLYTFTDTNTAGGNHSVVFSHWLGAIETVDGISYRRAVIFGQSSPSAGGRRSEWNLGEEHTTVRGVPVYPITFVQRYSEEAHQPETADDLITEDLHLDPAEGDRSAELLPQLGTGSSARHNFDLIMRMERRHHGRLDMERLKAQIRERNDGLITSLSSRMTAGQIAILQETNERDDLETLVRLNERLYVLTQNAEALSAAEAHETERVDPVHDERQAEVERQQRALRTTIEGLEGEIMRAQRVLDLDHRIRTLTREKRHVEGRIRSTQPTLRNRHLPAARRERLQRQLDRDTAHVAELTTELAELDGLRTTAATAEEEGRETNDIGRGLNSTQRVNRLTARRDRLERDYLALEASGGYHTAHPGSRDVFIGRHHAEHGSGTEREHRVTGHIEAVRPELDWAAAIVEGAPGSASEADAHRRAAARAARRPRR